MKHEERLKELDVMLKAFQTKLAFIQLLSKEQQDQDYKNLRDTLQEQMNSFFSGSRSSNAHGEY